MFTNNPFLGEPSLGDSWDGALGLTGDDAGGIHGDFYREPDDTVRGLTLCSGMAAADDFDFSCFDADEAKCGNHFALPSLGGAATTSPALQQQTSITSAVRFQDSDTPRDLPTDPFWNLEQTSLHLTAEAVTTANRLLDFLEEARALVTKVSHEKFSIKTEVAHRDGLPPCKLKVFVYRQPSGIAVEFQRRSGDGLVFNDIFHRASEYLNSYEDESATRTTVPASPSGRLPPLMRGAALPMMPVGWGGRGSSGFAPILQSPLFDMAGRTDDAQLQTEAAVGLAAMAKQDPHAASQMGGPEMRTAIQSLLGSGNSNVAEPTARLLSCLAQEPEAVKRLTEGGLTDDVSKCVQDTGMLVRHHLARAVSRAAGGTTDVPAKGVTIEELVLELSEVLGSRLPERQ